MCKTCGDRCGEEYNDGGIFIECPICGGRDRDCRHCEGGQIPITDCPRTMFGVKFAKAINIAGMSGGGDWPVAGGLMSQANWFLQLKQRLANDENLIQAEIANDG